MNVSQNISLANSQSYCCHIIARPDDEYRKNFPLTINDAPNRLDLTLYGSHSDIGGGYANRNYMTIIDFDEVVPPLKSNKLNNLLKEYGQLFAIQFEKQQPKFNKNNQLYIVKENQFKIDIANYSALKYDKSQEVKQKYLLVDNRKEMINKIQIVSLNAMKEIATKIGIKFNIEADYEFISKEDVVINESDVALNKYDNSVLELIKKAYATENAYVKGLSMEPEYFFEIYNKFIHISSNYNSPIAGIYYVNTPREKKIREIIEFPTTSP